MHSGCPSPRKVSTEAPNLSKGEMSFNFSLSISIQVSTTVGSQLLSMLNAKQSSSLGRTQVRWVWVEEAAWQHSSVEVARGQDLEAQCVFEPEASSGLLQASPPHSRGELWRCHVFIMPHPVYAIMFIKLCFSSMSIFAYFNPYVVSYFSSSHLLFELCNPVVGGPAWGTIGGP
jgi:hypothetical protein